MWLAPPSDVASLRYQEMVQETRLLLGSASFLAVLRQSFDIAFHLLDTHVAPLFASAAPLAPSAPSATATLAPSSEPAATAEPKASPVASSDAASVLMINVRARANFRLF